MGSLTGEGGGKTPRLVSKVVLQTDFCNTGQAAVLPGGGGKGRLFPVEQL
jgi:hypothetical protein